MMAQKLEIVFLGTASHTPTAKKNHTGVLVSHGSELMLFDCGEGIQRQFKIAKINPCKLTKVLLTHWHGDHALGVPGLLYTLKTSEYGKKLQIYGPQGTRKNLDLLERVYHKIKIDKDIKEVGDGLVFENKDIKIESLKMHHGIPAVAYSLTIKDKLRLDKNKIEKLNIPKTKDRGLLQQGKNIKHDGKTIKAKDVTYLEKGKKITVIMDTAMNSNAIKIAKDSDLLICESTYASDNKEKAKMYKHLTASEAATIAKKAKVKKLILTHISHRYQKDYSVVLNEAKKIFKNTILVKDFDKVVV